MPQANINKGRTVVIPHKRATESRPYASAFAILLTVVSIPSKFIFYAAGPALLAYWVISGRILDRRHYISLILITFTGCLSLALELEHGFAALPAALWPLTYGTFLLFGLVLLFPPAQIPSRNDLAVCARVACVWALLQGLVGIAQFAISGNPDAVAGTVGLFDYRDNITINQVYFGFAMLSLLPFIAMYPEKLPLRWPTVFVGLVAVLLSQSGHATIFFLISCLAFLLGPRSRKAIVVVPVVMALVAYGMLLLFPATVDLAATWAERTLGPDSPKLLMLENLAFQASEDFKFAMLGAGPGQYMSRAMLVGAGILTRVQWLGQEVPPRIDQFYWSIWYLYAEVGEGSAIAKPYNSYMSVFAEWGVVGLGALGLAIVVVLRRALLLAIRGRGAEVVFAGKYLVFYTLFLCLAAAIELYFEMPAAIAPGALLAVAVQARAVALQQKDLRQPAGGVLRSRSRRETRVYTLSPSSL